MPKIFDVTNWEDAYAQLHHTFANAIAVIQSAYGEGVSWDEEEGGDTTERRAVISGFERIVAGFAIASARLEARGFSQVTIVDAALQSIIEYGPRDPDGLADIFTNFQTHNPAGSIADVIAAIEAKRAQT